jgi:L-rhamnose mutarotase
MAPFLATLKRPTASNPPWTAWLTRPINAKWQEFMAPYFESPDGAHPDKTMVELEEVFHLD